MRELSLVRTKVRELNDLSGRLRLAQNDVAENFDGEVEFRHNRFEAEVEFDHSAERGVEAGEDSQSARWRFSTFAGYAGGKVAIGREAREGFVIASRHKSLKDAELAVLDQGGRFITAKAGALGPALIPIERGYTPRRHAIQVEPLPIGYDLGAALIDILPSPGAGYAYVIGSDASRTLLGTLKNSDGEAFKLAVGFLESVDGDEEKRRQFFTNSAGRFVAERVSAGEYTLVIDKARTEPFKIEDDTEGLVDVGEIIFP